jgi:hypothetical protein
MGTHRCKTHDVARLYSSLSTRVNDLAILAMRLPSIHSGNVPGSPVLHAGSWLCVHGLGLVRGVTLEQGEHNCLVRGVLVYRLRAC